MKKHFIYLTIIVLLIGFMVNAKSKSSQWFYFEEDVRHGLHYGIWSNMGQQNGPFVVRCFEVDSARAHRPAEKPGRAGR